MSAFVVATSSTAPEGSKRITKQQIQKFFSIAVRTWNDKNEVKWLLNGSCALGMISAATGLYCNYYYRHLFKLGAYGYFGTYVPLAVVPAVSSYVFHKKRVVTDIYSWHSGKCAACVQVKSVAVQAVTGVLQPVFLSLLTGIMFAIKHYNFPVPIPVKEPREFVKFAQKVTRPIGFKLAIALGLHAIAAMSVTHMELSEFCALHEKLMASVPAESAFELEEKKS